MSIIPHLYKKYVRGTAKKAIVQSVTVLLCHLTATVMKGVGSSCQKIYISTRVLKHIYDKRPAEEFDFCLEHVMSTVRYPNRVYKNKGGKRGAYIFVKDVQNSQCLVSVETVTDANGNATHCEVATFFRPSEGYLNSYELLWEWKDGTPSS